MGLLPTQGDEKRLLYSDYCSLEAPPSPLSSRPERTRISYFALLATTTCAALLKESRMQIIKATGLYRKSGGAQWRDLCVDALSWKCFRQWTVQRTLLGFTRACRRLITVSG